jgi:hypothetical protein
MIRRLRPNPDFGAYLDSGAPEFGYSTLWLVNTPEIGGTTCGFMILACCPQAWEHMGVMEGAVKILDVRGLGPGNKCLGGLTKPNLDVRYLIEVN